MICIKDLSIRGVQLFLTAARLQSIGAAASHHHLSQPAASRALQRLEQQLGLSLLIHGRHRFELTDAGRELLRIGPRLLEDLEGGLNRLGQSPALRLGMPHSLAVAWAPFGLTKLLPLRYSLQTGRPDELWQRVLTGVLDCAVVLDTSAYPGVAAEPLWEGEFALIAHHQLSPQPIWISSGQLDTMVLQMHFQSTWGKDLEIAGELPSWEVIRAVAKQPGKVGWVPDYLLWGEKELQILNWQLPKISYVALAIARQDFWHEERGQQARAWLKTAFPPSP